MFGAEVDVKTSSYFILILIQTHHHDNQLAEVMITILLLFYAFGGLLIACECGQRTNQAFEECTDMIDQFKWYLFPKEIKRILPLILAFTQQPFELTVFGSASCDRESFKYVRMTKIKAIQSDLIKFTQN